MSKTSNKVNKKQSSSSPQLKTSAEILDLIKNSLDESKADNIVTIDLAGKTSIADFMIIASGDSRRKVAFLAEYLCKKLKNAGTGKLLMEGRTNCDWILIDAGDIIVHLFRPDIRDFYNLEKIWITPHTKSTVEKSI